jgi:hypothetical protein
MNTGLCSRLSRHSASLRAFTPVFDGLWTRVDALKALGRDDKLRTDGFRYALNRYGPADQRAFAI